MDRTAVVEQRRRDVFRDWLEHLGPREWAGTASELFEELERFRASHSLRFGCNFSGPAGLSRWLVEAENVIFAAGRKVLFTRTRAARLIAFTAPGSRPTVSPPTPAPAPRPAVVRRARPDSAAGVLDLFEE